MLRACNFLSGGRAWHFRLPRLMLSPSSAAKSVARAPPCD